MGVVEVNAEGLLSNEVIDINAEILNDNGDKVGHIFFKIFWFESQRDSDPVAP